MQKTKKNRKQKTKKQKNYTEQIRNKNWMTDKERQIKIIKKEKCCVFQPALRCFQHLEAAV